jgi:uncharacterized protein (TIGR03663 family)
VRSHRAWCTTPLPAGTSADQFVTYVDTNDVYKQEVHQVMINDYLPATVVPRRPLLDRRFNVAGISTEILLYALLFLGSILLHLWQLDVKAMHHDESIHAWISYRFFNGIGPFTCVGGRQSETYCYDPVYHGPSLYLLTALAFFLFGDGDAQSRLPMALAGIALVPMAWTLRPFIGRKGALLAAGLMTISPSILYYTRFARHDALVLLWSLFMLVGLFRFLRHGGATNLSLAAAGLALTWATHELVFILIFIGTSFLGFRLLWEWKPRLLRTAAVAVLALAAVYIAAMFAVSEQQAPALYSLLHRFFGPALLLGTGALLILPITRHWETQPIVLNRLLHTWRHERGTFWAAGITFLVVFTLLFTTLFAYPLGFLDGWYQGIRYWLGSQHAYARGEQPWFYYLMLLPLYEPLALIFGLVGLTWLTISGLRLQQTPPAEELGAQPTTAGIASDSSNGDIAVSHDEHGAAKAYAMPSQGFVPPLLVFFLGYWFVQAFVAFSWAGEKMPWLLTHITLPGILLAAWVLGVLIDRIPSRALWHRYGWVVPLLTLLLLLMTLMATYYLAGAGQTITDLHARLQGLFPLVIAGLSLFGLLAIASKIGGHVVLRLAALGIAIVLLLYGIRAAALVVYQHPDTPVEPLIYTQTAPSVPLLVDQIREIAINQMRDQRTVQDPTGSLSMPITLDGGASQHGGEGSVAWPMQWYLRDFQNVRWLDVDTSTTIDPESRIIVLYKPHLTPDLSSQLEAEYVKTMEGPFNWWFPEYTGYYDLQHPSETPLRGYKTLGAEGIGAVLAWPFTPSNWPTLGRYLLYRELPIALDGREMVVYMRRDVVPGGASPTSSITTDTVVPDAVLAQGQLNNARGITVDHDGNLYIADANNHRILILKPNGEQLRTLGSLGNGDGQLNEPSGVAVDDDGNVYIADTWNSRIVKFGANGTFLKAWGTSTTPFGGPIIDPQTGQGVQRYATDTGGLPEANAQNPLGFFGPRNVLVWADHVYVADTGNSRVVVTDREGNVVQQFGNQGAAPGQMHEPIGLAVDAQNRLYVGDTWNGRIQVFQLKTDGLANPTPLATFDVTGWAPQTYNDPYIAVSPDGRVWASQGARNTVAEYNAAYQLVRRIKTEPALVGPKGLATSPDGALFVVNSEQNAVVRLRLP